MVQYKLKPRSFYKFTHLQAHFVVFHLQCELHLTQNHYLYKCHLVYAHYFQAYLNVYDVIYLLEPSTVFHILQL